MVYCKWGLVILLMLIVGCASLNTTETRVVTPEGDIYIVNSKKNAMVTLRKKGTELIVDNRGKMGLFENLMGIMLMKTDINLKNKEGD